jgi:DNA-binding FadR family transcriptional regulator
MGGHQHDDIAAPEKRTSNLQRNPSSSLACHAAQRLREFILSIPDSTYLGSEGQLRLKFQVSRSILRQVARILEYEQLLFVRRGIKGGYYSRRPSIANAASVAALYLRAHRATIGEVARMSEVFNVEAARLAALASNEEARGALAELRTKIASYPDVAYSAAQLFRDSAASFEAVMRLAATPTLELFQRTLFEFGTRVNDHHVFREHPERRQQWRQARIQLLDAILGRDAELAALLARRQSENAYLWICEDDDQKVDQFSAFGELPSII